MDPRDEMLRDAARHRGFRLLRSRRRKPGGDFGKYGLADAATGESCLGVGEEGLTASYEEVADFLRGRTAADWRESLGATPARKPPPPRRRRKQERPAARGKDARKEPAKRKPPPPPPPPPPELAIRPARKGDAEALASLLAGIGEAVGPAGMRKRIERAARAGMPVIVADRGGLVGCVSPQLVPLLHRLEPVGRIGSLFVVAASRRRGIGTALVEAAEAALREAGCGAVEAMSEIDFDSPHGFFRKAGYRQTAYRFTKDPPEA